MDAIATVTRHGFQDDWAALFRLVETADMVKPRRLHSDSYHFQCELFRYYGYQDGLSTTTKTRGETAGSLRASSVVPG